MAKLIELGESTPEERAALRYLSELLPDDYTLTTTAQDIQGRELDSVLICPHGLMYLELKHWRGTVVPRHYGTWGRDPGWPVSTREKNPFQQGDEGSKKLASFLKQRFRSTRLPAKVEYLIVLTHPTSSLDLSDLSLTPSDKTRVTLLDQAPDILAARMQRTRRLTLRQMALTSIFLRYPGISLEQALQETNDVDTAQPLRPELHNAENERTRELLRIQAFQSQIEREGIARRQEARKSDLDRIEALRAGVRRGDPGVRP